MLEKLFDAAFNHIASGGPGVAWALVVYLLWRMHQLTDRQHAANLDTVKALATIRTLLVAKLGAGDLE